MNKICNRVYMTLPTRAPHWNVNSKFRLRNMIDPPSTPLSHFMHPSADSARAQIQNQRNSAFWYFTPTLFWYSQCIFLSRRLPFKHLNLEKRRLITKRVDTTKSFNEFQLFKSSFVFCTYCSACWGHFLPVLRRRAVQIAKLLNCFPILSCSVTMLSPFREFRESIVGDFHKRMQNEWEGKNYKWLCNKRYLLTMGQWLVSGPIKRSLWKNCETRRVHLKFASLEWKFLKWYSEKWRSIA